MKKEDYEYGIDSSKDEYGKYKSYKAWMGVKWKDAEQLAINAKTITYFFLKAINFFCQAPITTYP